MTIRKSRKGAVFAGTEFALTIDISFSNNSCVDVDIVFVIEWSREGNVIVNDDRIKISGEQLVLTCIVRVVEHLISVPSVE